MGWNHPEISLQEMVKLIKGFVDMLILASGFQSSGLPARWDGHDVKKAFHWALFFENVFNHLSILNDNEESLHELDANLTQMISDPAFPKGLSHLSSTTLRRAKAFLCEHLIRALALRDSHLKSFLKAVIEMDLSELSETEHHCLHPYHNIVNISPNLVPGSEVFDKERIVPSSNIAPPLNVITRSGHNFTKFAVEELLKRQSAVSCTSTVKTGLYILASAVRQDIWNQSNNNLMEEHLKPVGPSIITGIVDNLVDFVTWYQWKSRNLLYFLNGRTVRLVSGSSMIFSASKFLWLQVLERLRTSPESHRDDLSEIIELMLFGCVASRWSLVVEYFMSISYDSLSISKQYVELCKGMPPSFHAKEKLMNSKENCILEHLIRLVSGQLRWLWKLSPALVAVAIPSWSPLYGLYLSELESQLKGNISTLRCCNCSEDGLDHKDCELGERIWLLYAFHVRYGDIIA